MTTITRLAALLFIIIACFMLPANAQTNYEFSYFQCSPTSCEEAGLLEKTGSASVELYSDCTGGRVSGINRTVTTTLLNCSVPYTPFAQVERSRTELENSDACPPYFYYVDYATFIAEIFNNFGTTVWHADATYGCDDSVSGPTNFGTKPC